MQTEPRGAGAARQWWQMAQIRAKGQEAALRPGFQAFVGLACHMRDVKKRCQRAIRYMQRGLLHAAFSGFELAVRNQVRRRELVKRAVLRWKTPALADAFEAWIQGVADAKSQAQTQLMATSESTHELLTALSRVEELERERELAAQFAVEVMERDRLKFGFAAFCSTLESRRSGQSQHKARGRQALWLVWVLLCQDAAARRAEEGNVRLVSRLRKVIWGMETRLEQTDSRNRQIWTGLARQLQEVAAQVKDAKLQFARMQQDLQKSTALSRACTSDLSTAKKSANQCATALHRLIGGVEHFSAVTFTDLGIVLGDPRPAADGRMLVHVAQLIAGGPAEASGQMRVEDLLLEVDGVSLAGMSPLEVQEALLDTAPAKRDTRERQVRLKALTCAGPVEIEYETSLIGAPAAESLASVLHRASISCKHAHWLHSILRSRGKKMAQLRSELAGARFTHGQNLIEMHARTVHARRLLESPFQEWRLLAQHQLAAPDQAEQQRGQRMVAIEEGGQNEGRDGQARSD